MNDGNLSELWVNAYGSIFSYSYLHHPKIKFSIWNFFNKPKTLDLVTFTEEILNGKIHTLCSESWCKIKMNCFTPTQSPTTHPKNQVFDAAKIIWEDGKSRKNVNCTA